MRILARATVCLALFALAFPGAARADERPEREGLIATSPSSGNLVSRWATAARNQANRRKETATARPAAFAGGHPHWISVAQRYKGTNPTKRKSLWCADFMNLVLAKSGMKGTSSSMARDFASYGTRLPGPKIGAIAVISRGKRGGHVGIVTRIDERGNPVLISGNHNNRVAEAAYPKGRVIAYVWPTS